MIPSEGEREREREREKERIGSHKWVVDMKRYNIDKIQYT